MKIINFQKRNFKISNIDSLECYNCNFCNDFFVPIFVPRIVSNTTSCFVIKIIFLNLFIEKNLIIIRFYASILKILKISNFLRKKQKNRKMVHLLMYQEEVIQIVSLIIQVYLVMEQTFIAVIMIYVINQHALDHQNITFMCFYSQF